MATSRRATSLEGWTAPRGRRWSQRDGERMLAALRSSGLSAARFAARHGLTAQRVYWWHHRLRDSAPTSRVKDVRASRPTLVPVHIVHDAPEVTASADDARNAVVEIAVGNNAVVRVHQGFDEQLLRRVLQTLRGASC